jgi:universal stress protein E
LPWQRPDGLEQELLIAPLLFSSAYHPFERESVMKILCATDLLPKSESAIDRAGMLAEHLGADLSLLHVVRPTESDQMLEQDVQRASRQLKFRAGLVLWRYGPLPNVHVQAGNPTRVLLDTMKELKPDLIVLGRHHRRPARDSLVGTIAARVLSERQCPVLIVERMAWDAYCNIVLALDRTKASVEAVRLTESMVLKDGMRAMIIHVHQMTYDGVLTSAEIAGSVGSEYFAAVSLSARAALRALLIDVSNDPSRYGLVIEDGTPAEAIQKVVRRLNPDLLVMGTRGHGRLRRALLGSVANRVLATARCDVLVVPERADVTSRRERIDHRSLDVVTGV